MKGLFLGSIGILYFVVHFVIYLKLFAVCSLF